MVKAGTYAENVKMTKSGTTDKPIWLVSADGEGAATIKAANSGLAVVYGYGQDNFVVKGFQLSGGTEGIKFTQGGTNLTNMANNIVIEENHVYGQKYDGIKTAQTVNIAITGNTVHNVATQEGVDNVYMRNGVIANNEVYDVRGLSGIVVKAGSQNIKILNNYVHGVPDGILVGGFSDRPGSIFPVGLKYQAKGVTVQDNKVSASKQRGQRLWRGGQRGQGELPDRHRQALGRPGRHRQSRLRLPELPDPEQRHIEDQLAARGSWGRSASIPETP